VFWVALVECRAPSCAGPGSVLSYHPELVSKVSPALSGAQRASLLKYIVRSYPLDSPAVERLWYDLLNMNAGKVHDILEERRSLGEDQFCEHTVANAPLVLLTEMQKLIQDRVKEGDTFVDFGSGMGEPCLFFALRNEGLTSTGFEISPEKVHTAMASINELGISDLVKLNVQDLSFPSFNPPKSTFYYLWNPLLPEILSTIFDKLHQRYKKGESFSILTHASARGNEWTSHYLRELPWLVENKTHASSVKPISMPPIGSWRSTIFDTVPQQKKVKEEI
jgi:hypothetical protein